MGLYSVPIRLKVRELMAFKPYPNLKFSVAEYSNMLTVRVYEDNIYSFSQEQYFIILEYLEKVRTTIESFGVKCEIEGVKS